MASGQPAQCQITSLHQPVRFNCLNSVLGATRVEAAVRADHRADHQLIEADKPNQDSTHVLPMTLRHARSRPSNRSRLLRCLAVGAQSTTMSTAGRALALRRKLARAIRLSLFRSTARGQERLEIASPNRAKSWSLIVARRKKPVPSTRAPCANTRLNCSACTSRRERGKRFTRSVVSGTVAKCPSKINECPGISWR
jgi:hypothetical protein